MTDLIPRRKLFQEVLDRLMERIRTGAIPPGAQLPSERELMKQYGVGRPAIREALQSLERSGILEIAHGERARVVVPTADLLIGQIAGGAMHLLRTQPDSLEHLKDARIFMETGMARLAAELATEADIARLRQAVANHRASLHDLDRFIELDMLFHVELATISGNPIFPSLVEAMFRWAGVYYQTMVRAPGVEELTFAEHDRIVSAIEAHDPETAAQAMHMHLTRANMLYQRAQPGTAG